MLGNMTCTLGTTLSKMLSNTYSLSSNIYVPRIQHIYPTYTWSCYPTYISPCYPTYITCPDYTCCPTYMILYMLGNISGALYMLGNISYMLDYMWPNIYTCYPTYIGNRKMHPTYTSNIYIQHIYEGIYVGYMCWVTHTYMLDYITCTQYICWVTWGFVDVYAVNTVISVIFSKNHWILLNITIFIAYVIKRTKMNSILLTSTVHLILSNTEWYNMYIFIYILYLI